MPDPLGSIRAAVAQRRSTPVDGGGLLPRDHAERVARAIGSGHIDQLAHELGNLVVPLLAALKHLIARVECEPGSADFDAGVRALVTVERIADLHQAVVHEARRRIEPTASTIDVRWPPAIDAAVIQELTRALRPSADVRARLHWVEAQELDPALSQAIRVKGAVVVRLVDAMYREDELSCRSILPEEP